jgi:hypothetical protein
MTNIERENNLSETQHFDEFIFSFNRRKEQIRKADSNI